MEQNESIPPSEEDSRQNKKVINPSFFKRKGKNKQNQSFLKTKIIKLKKNYRDYLLDHAAMKEIMHIIFMLFIQFLSAFLFAFGFKSFMAPQIMIDGKIVNHMVSGGASGISQVITKILILCGVDSNLETTFQSIFYFVVNIPMIILGFIGVGKKFTFWTLVNVAFTSLLIKIIPDSWCNLFNFIAQDYIVRALAGGIMTGLSSGLALMTGTSTGGIDIISLYVAEKKSTSVGKYSLMINTITVITYTLLSYIKIGGGIDTASGNEQLTMALYTVVYFFVSTKVLDLLNVKNKKVQLQIITAYNDMQKVLIHGFPHSCTLIDAKGGFTGSNVKVIYMVVSKSECKKVVNVVRQVDPKSFISVQKNDDVYGNFYIKPID